MKYNVILGRLKPYLLLAIATLVVVLFQYFIGIKYSQDSNWYLLFSDQIGNLNTFDRMAVFAPLYYWSLGLLKFLGISTTGSILVYWWIAYFSLTAIFFSLTRSILISVLALVTILSNATTLKLFGYVWTELGYSVLLASAVFALYILSKKDVDVKNRYKIIFLISIALLPIQRYIGAYLSVYLGLIYLFYTREFIWKRLSELIVSTLPLIFVILWNLLLTGHISGSREPAIYSFMDNLDLARKAISHHFRPEWILLVTGIVLLSRISWKKKKFNFLLFLLFVPIVQLFSQVLSSSIYLFDTIDSRFFIVTTPTIVLVLMLLLQDLFDKKRNIFHISIILLFALLTSLNFIHKQPVISHEDQNSFSKVRSFLATIKNVNTVGIFISGLQQGAELILTSKIVPAAHCQRYHSVGDFRNWEISYIPDCKNLQGFTYIPLKIKDERKPKVIIVSKNGLPENWKEVFSNYKIINLGSFYGLKKREQ